MKKPTKTAGKDPMMGFRASPALRASIIRWAETHPNVRSLSEAARLLVELGLAASSPSRPSGKTNNAARMASRQLDRLADKTASEKEQASRKRRLLGGPEEFQSLRVDRRKAEIGAQRSTGRTGHARSEAHRKQDR